MGAVPGGSLLSVGPGGLEAWFDVDRFRTAGRRAVVRSVDRPVLVLGSTQDAAIVDVARLRASGVGVVRRRSGGGAVLLGPAAQIWVDIWVPRHDPLWTPEPRVAAELVGGWWAASLPPGIGPGAVTVHRGPPVHGPDGGLLCFAGIGAGEVLVGERKLVGLAQWRSKEGALVHGCAYRAWDPEPLALVLADVAPDARPEVPGDARPEVPGDARPEVRGANLPRDAAALASVLGCRAVGLDQVGAKSWTAERLLATLPDPGSWEVVRS